MQYIYRYDDFIDRTVARHGETATHFIALFGGEDTMSQANTTQAATTPDTIVNVQGVSMTDNLTIAKNHIIEGFAPVEDGRTKYQLRVTDNTAEFIALDDEGNIVNTTTVEDRKDGRYINGKQNNPDAQKYPLSSPLATGYTLCKEDIKPEKIGILYAVWVEGKDKQGKEFDTLVGLVDDTQDIITQYFNPADAIAAARELRRIAAAEKLELVYTPVTIMPVD